jgi:hypothetical protein
MTNLAICHSEKDKETENKIRSFFLYIDFNKMKIRYLFAFFLTAASVESQSQVALNQEQQV